ncbi:unnamed protein product [Parascedosporium putredinis]|uniref:Membrane transporter n=1 Tax=Parascedosporium putredinis TaxID=1442378 RepID=A0A9P1MB84_9PEZI|nr:unnamed protein product [Parascedosporium putredinis]CAI7995760.1 unnamed protein product [Parascedosporium putredinis]
MPDDVEAVKATGPTGDEKLSPSSDNASEEATIIPQGALDPVYEAKARVLNRAIQDIGMGWYQWQLFIVVGFGWASDNLWPIWGNLPVDSAIFLEFLPASHQYLLTVLSIDWALAQVVATLIAWPLLGNLTCQQEEENCTRSKNAGWRWFVITVGGLTLLMFFIRFLLFSIYESPKYLMGKGRDEQAVLIVHEVARRNGKTTNLTIEDLRACEPPGYVAKTDASTAVKRHLEKLSFSHVRALFSSRRLALSTGLIMVVWALIGLGYPLYNAFLPFIQATRGADFGDGSTYLTYRNSLIIAVLGVPGALLGGWLIELPRMGRKGTLSLSTVLTGVFLYCSTTALNSAALLGWNCAFSFTSNVMYAVLYGFTPELFPTPQRGPGML